MAGRGWERTDVVLNWYGECTLQMDGRMLQHEIFGYHAIRL